MKLRSLYSLAHHAEQLMLPDEHIAKFANEETGFESGNNSNIWTKCTVQSFLEINQIGERGSAMRFSNILNEVWKEMSAYSNLLDNATWIMIRKLS